MIADLKPYPEMKDSGVKWLGEVPEHWDIRRSKYIFRCINERSKTGDEELLTVSSAYGVIPRKSTSVTMFKAESYVGHKLCWPDDLVINSLWAWGRGLGFSEHHGIVSTAYGVYRLRSRDEAEPRYLDTLVRSTPFHWELRVRSKGIWISRLQLTDESFLGSELPLPPLPEQAAIVQYLDHVDRRVRRLVRAKRKLIALLTEQKQAIIHCAVTRGLDPDVSLKDSGVEWLSGVPEHWEVRRLKGVLDRSLRNGLFKKKDAFGSGVPLVNVADVYQEDFEVDPTTLERVQATEEEVRTFRVESGDLFFVRSSLKLEGTGRSAVAMSCESDTVFECHLVQARPDRRRALPRFLSQQLNSYGLSHYLISRANIVTMATVAQGTLSACPVFLPPLSEQEAILRHVDAECRDLRTSVSCAAREVELLNELRTRLIADVVTGKLDVREAASALPDVDPLEDEDDLDDTLEAEAAFDDLDAIPEEAEA